MRYSRTAVAAAAIENTKYCRSLCVIGKQARNIYVTREACITERLVRLKF